MYDNNIILDDTRLVLLHSVFPLVIHFNQNIS